MNSISINKKLDYALIGAGYALIACSLIITYVKNKPDSNILRDSVFGSIIGFLAAKFLFLTLEAY